MKLSLQELSDRTKWEKAGIALPRFDPVTVREKTEAAPVWVHFGAGNIFRGFIASLQQRLLNDAWCDRGIIAAAPHDFENIDRTFTPFDNLTVNVTLSSREKPKAEVLAAVAFAKKADWRNPDNWTFLCRAFRSPSLQMVSCTITEKAYALTGSAPDTPEGAMEIIAALLYERFLSGKHPISVVSMDNCSQNGDKLRALILKAAETWEQKGFVQAGFYAWLADRSAVSFPLTMIDKITPRPSPQTARLLREKGLENTDPFVTERFTFAAPFVNGEKPEYLVIEDRFPNGRPPLEKAGVYFCDRQTVTLCERMKVTACLNPLHTALAVFGCLLGYDYIWEETKDPLLDLLIRRLGYRENLPVVENPGILSPERFLDEVLTERFPNSFLPDTPQRIATDTSQKLPIRFGETLKAYLASSDLDTRELIAIPLVFAGWLRYLTGVNDSGESFSLSPDPLLSSLAPVGEKLKNGGDVRDITAPLLHNREIFGVDLFEAGLAEKVCMYLSSMLKGQGAVRKTLEEVLCP